MQDKLECATTLADICNHLTWKPKPPAQDPPVFIFCASPDSYSRADAGPLVEVYGLKAGK